MKNNQTNILAKKILTAMVFVAVAGIGIYFAVMSRPLAPEPTSVESAPDTALSASTGSSPNSASNPQEAAQPLAPLAPATGPLATASFAFAFSKANNYAADSQGARCPSLCIQGHYPPDKAVRILIGGGISCSAKTAQAYRTAHEFTELNQIDGCTLSDLGSDLAVAIVDDSKLLSADFQWLAIEEVEQSGNPADISANAAEQRLRANKDAAKIMNEFAKASTLADSPGPKIVAVGVKAGALSLAQARVEDPNSKKSLTLGPIFSLTGPKPILLTGRDALCSTLKGAFRLANQHYVLTEGGSCNTETYTNTHVVHAWNGKAWTQVATLIDAAL